MSRDARGAHARARSSAGNTHARPSLAALGTGESRVEGSRRLSTGVRRVRFAQLAARG